MTLTEDAVSKPDKRDVDWCLLANGEGELLTIPRAIANLNSVELS